MADLQALDVSNGTNGVSHRHAIVLAGGEGKRLADVAHETYGYPRPKQFCQFGSDRSLLEETLERAERFTQDRARIAVSLTRSQRAETDECLRGWPEVLRVEQPSQAGTTPAIVLPLLHVLERDPEATVLVLPSDHHISDDEVFVHALVDACRVLDEHPDVVLLAGMHLAAPEPGLGWIVPGADQGGWRPINRFVEKPTDASAAALCASGALANTFVILARASSLANLCWMYAPMWWVELGCSVGDQDALARLYARERQSGFSHDVLAKAEGSLGVVPIEGVVWSDIGTPERLFAMRRTPAASGPPKRSQVV